MPRKLVSRMSERECHTLSETDTIKIASQRLDEKKIGCMPVLDKNKNVYGYFSSKMLKLRAEGYNVIQVKLSENDEFYHRIYELAEINLDKK